MKKSDIMTVVIIAVVGTLVAYFTVNGILGKASDASYSFKTMSEINADLASPDPEVFNREAINPTIEVYVGECTDVDMDGKISKAERINCGGYNGTGANLRWNTDDDGNIIDYDDDDGDDDDDDGGDEEE